MCFRYATYLSPQMDVNKCMCSSLICEYWQEDIKYCQVFLLKHFHPWVSFFPNLQVHTFYSTGGKRTLYTLTNRLLRFYFYLFIAVPSFLGGMVVIGIRVFWEELQPLCACHSNHWLTMKEFECLGQCYFFIQSFWTHGRCCNDPLSSLEA